MNATELRHTKGGDRSAKPSLSVLFAGACIALIVVSSAAYSKSSKSDLFGRWAHPDFMSLCDAAIDDEETAVLVEQVRVRGTGWECKIKSWNQVGPLWKPIGTCFSEGSDYNPKILIGLTSENKLLFIVDDSITVLNKCRK